MREGKINSRGEGGGGTEVGNGPDRALRERERRWSRGSAKRDEGISPVSRFEESASVSSAGKQSEGQPQAWKTG